jgi:signal transduction histidine kinase
VTTTEAVGGSSLHGRAPLAIAALIPVVILALMPWRSAHVADVPGFSGLWLAVLVFSDLLVVYLLLGQYRAGASLRLVGLAWAYLWSAAVAVVFMFGVPGVLLDAPARFADANTTQWLWVWRHVFPPLFIGLALAPGWGRESLRLGRDAVVRGSLAIGVVACGAFALVCGLSPRSLPVIVDPVTGHAVGWVTVSVLAVGLVSVALAAVGVWRRGRSSGHQTLESWAVVATVTFLGDSILTFLYEDRFTLAYFLSRLLGLSGSVLVLFALLHDMARIHAARTETAARLEVQNAELLEAQRLRDHLTAVVSHDLRTPIAGLQGYLELLRDDELDTPLARRMLDRSWLLTRRLTLMTEDLLAAATLENGDLLVSPEWLDIEAQLGECASCFPDLDLELDCPPGLRGYADPLRLQQVLVNLVRNAQKHGAEPVRIAAESAPGASGTVLVKVSDAGAGVPSAFVPKLFERYTQGATAARGGSGLGLSVVRDLVAAHGGTVHYETAGNAFVLTLPAERSAVPFSAASGRATFPAPRAAARG